MILGDPFQRSSETSYCSVGNLFKKAAVLFWVKVVYQMTPPLVSLTYEEMEGDSWAAKISIIILKPGYSTGLPSQ